ncbi:phage major capsid protein [Mycobacterium sp. Y57]|uniref:phage major capsid protein n=1 Tax=Mycolicibacterium xanthum TaxID=2796469 RepID=UPI001C84F05B|nr:phage major capsid protein [Mycolicibacterium xanthum]MBX7433779.1 phage major capsid protein [Mycolicibacterium xanthum]
MNTDLVARLRAAKTTEEIAAIAAKAVSQTSNTVNALRDSGGDFLGTPVTAPAFEVKTGAQSNPLRIDAKAIKGLYNAAVSKQGFAVKAYSSVESLLPAQLDPAVLGQVHENRVLDYLPTRPISAPSLEVIVHSSTTGAPTSVAEGAAKPEIVLNTTSETFTAVKLAAHVGISYETLQDFGAFQGYTQHEMMRQIQDVENAQILSGAGTGTDMTGFTATSGVLTHDASLDTGTNETALDSIEKAITALRSGTSLAEANFIVMSPATYSSMRRLKNTYGEFLIGEPAAVGARQLFGVPVALTTAIADGTAVMLDTTKFGFVAVREGLTVHVGQSGTDFIDNISRFVMEERLVLCVERPSAVMVVSNLATA